MAKVKTRFRTSKGFFDDLKKLLFDRAGKRGRVNFGNLRPHLIGAINDGVEDTKHKFIPNDREAAQLGIGADGSIDREKTEGAWKLLLAGDRSNITKLSVRSASSRSNRLGVVRITIDEEEFFAAPECNVTTPDSEKIDSIPWMRWFLRGAPTNPEYRFFGKHGIPVSRTGRGIMVKGGVWTFPPAEPLVIDNLSRNVLKSVRAKIRKDIGRVLYD